MAKKARDITPPRTTRSVALQAAAKAIGVGKLAKK